VESTVPIKAKEETMQNTEMTRTASKRLWRSSRLFIATVMLVALAMFVGGSLTNPAYANTYPSWQDVQNAKNNESAKAAQVKNIQGLIAALASEVAAAQAEADAKGAEYGIALDKFSQAENTAMLIEDAAAAATEKAKTASTQAGRLAAQLYRSGGSDLSITLLTQSTSSGADKLLSKLGSMSKLSERSNSIYAEAQAAKNEAESLSKQAEVAVAAREELRAEAEVAFNAAVAAQEAAQAKLDASVNQQMILQAQLAALQDATAATVSGYEAGVREAQRIAAERAAAEAAARGIAISGAGWTHPVPAAYVSDVWGPRPNFYIPGVGWTGSFHNATDLAARCGTPIYAASGGTVTYAGAIGGYGYMVEINHGGGIRTRYGHVTSNGINVGYGQQVGPGELIARVGRTGLSTGCHTHYEVHTGGGSRGVDPQPFMRARGVEL
jgi:murein DD-endopeptidase MepM/ murein hydrolase activator NlpD